MEKINVITAQKNTGNTLTGITAGIRFLFCSVSEIIPQLTGEKPAYKKSVLHGKIMMLALLLVLVIGNVTAQTRVQTATGNTGGTANTTFTVNLTSAPVNGNTLIAVISTRGTSDYRVSSITQTNVTNWKRVVQKTNTSGVTTEIWYAPVTAAGGTSVTINLAASLRAAAAVMEYSGILTPDITATQSQNNASPSTGTPWDSSIPMGIPTNQDNEVWVGGISLSLANGDRTLTGVYNDFSLIGGNAVTSGATTTADTKLYALDRIVDFTQAPNSGGRLSGTAQWAGAIATFMKTTIARVQSATGNTGSSATTPITVNLSSTPINGNTMIAVISTRGNSDSRVSTITQPNVTNWTRVVQKTNPNGVTTEIWYAPVTSTSAAKVVTINLASSLRAAAVVMEYSGILTAVSPVDQTTSAASSSSSSSPTTGTSALTTQENELWIGGIGYSSSSPTLGSLTNSFSEIANVASTSGTYSSNAKVYALEKIVTTTGTASTGGTLTSSVQWSGAIATFMAPIEAAPYCNIIGTSIPIGWTNTLFTGAGGSLTTVPVNVTPMESNIYKGVKNSIPIDVYAGENITINPTSNNGFSNLNCFIYADWNKDNVFEYLGQATGDASSRILKRYSTDSCTRKIRNYPYSCNFCKGCHRITLFDYR